MATALSLAVSNSITWLGEGGREDNAHARGGCSIGYILKIRIDIRILIRPPIKNADPF